MKNWFVYIILCTDKSLYTGISTDVKKRFQEHNSQSGAKYFRFHKPSQVVYMESGHDRSSATKREIEIKNLVRADKIKLISSLDNQMKNIDVNYSK